MIARFLQEGLIQTLDLSRDFEEFSDKFPSCRKADPSQLYIVLDGFRKVAVSPVRYIVGDDWVVFGAVCRPIPDTVNIKFRCCYCPKGRMRTWRSMTFPASNFTDTKENQKILWKSVEDGMRMISTARSFDAVQNLMKKMIYGETRWTVGEPK